MSDEAAAAAPEVPAHCVSAHGSTNAELLGLIRQGNAELRAHMQTDLEKLITDRLMTHQAEQERKFEAKLIEMQNSLQKDQAALISRLNLLESRSDDGHSHLSGSTRASLGSASKRHRSADPIPPARMNIDEEKSKHRVWIVGFGRKLLAANFNEFCTAALRENIEDSTTRNNITLNCYNLKDHCSMDFQTINLPSPLLRQHRPAANG